jgi:hypothetical protein
MARAPLPGTWAWLAWVVASAVSAAQADPAGREAKLRELELDIEQLHRFGGMLVELDQKLGSLPRFGPQTPSVQRRYCELLLRSALLKQSAINRAIAAYGIDVRNVPFGVAYSPHGGMRDREGATYVDGDGTIRVEIGDEAFASAARLGSTIAHEVEVHVNRQVVNGIFFASADEQGWLIQEVEAYDYELASKERFGLSADEIRLVKLRRASCYRRLQWENRRRADAALYVAR